MNSPACPICHMEALEPDTIAIHMIDAHQSDYERTRLWLRDTVEEEAFNDPE